MSILDLSDQGLLFLPRIPDTVRILYCHNNKLTSLDGLHNDIRILYCSGNLIKELSNLPENLEYLNIDDHVVLKDIPYSLNWITKSEPFEITTHGIRSLIASIDATSNKLKLHNDRRVSLGLAQDYQELCLDEWNRIKELYCHQLYAPFGSKYNEMKLLFEEIAK